MRTAPDTPPVQTILRGTGWGEKDLRRVLRSACQASNLGAEYLHAIALPYADIRARLECAGDPLGVGTGNHDKDHRLAAAGDPRISATSASRRGSIARTVIDRRERARQWG